MKLHKNLKRQLRKAGLGHETLPDDISDWEEFLELVSQTYENSEEDRYLLERSLEISSKEMGEKIEKNKEMSMALVQASKLSSLGTLSSGIAHELNNPITALIGYISAIIKGRYDEDEQIEKLLRCKKQLNRMASIVGHLRKLSRDSKDEEFKIVNLFDPINDSFDLLGSQLSYENISFSVKSNFEEAIISGDHNKLESVIQNFISNSLHAFQSNKDIKNKEIKICIDQDYNEGTVKIIYEDNAGGMDEKTFNNIFDPFFTTKEVGKGTGLGMSIAHTIIEEHGGNIQCETEEGKGTIFYMNFPIYTLNLEVVESLDQSNTSKFPKLTTMDKKILFVDDEVDIVEAYVDILEELFVVTPINNPYDALIKIEEESFDLIITDIKMPGMSGIEFAHAVRDKFPNMPIIFISGHASGELKDEIESFDNSLFVEKPFPDDVIFLKFIKGFVSAA
jgi:signal transduction histidine kinase